MLEALGLSLDDDLATYWRARVAQHTQGEYLGVPLSKFPEDLSIYERLLFDGQVDTVIELGAQHGGSALWFRDRLRTLAAYGRIRRPLVISVDIEVELAVQGALRVDPSLEGIVFLDGDVLDPELPALVRSELPEGARCLVIEDTAHVYDTTMAALRGFAPFVGPGGHLVIEDGVIDIERLRPYDDWPRGVLPALETWLASSEGAGFRRRSELEAYGVTCHPGGFLQRIP